MTSGIYILGAFQERFRLPATTANNSTTRSGQDIRAIQQICFSIHAIWCCPPVAYMQQDFSSINWASVQEQNCQ